MSSSADGHRLTRLAGGARVITAPMRERASVSVALLVAAGSRYEQPEKRGVAHFIEHMVFKGSERYPTARHISEAVEGVGGVLNAATDKEMTMFWAKVPAEHQSLAIEVLGDMVFHSSFDTGEIAKERQVVIEELRMYQDNPQEHVSTLFEEAMWPDHPLGWDTAGNEESVRAIERDDCMAFLARHYHADRIVASMAGAIDHGDALAQVSEALGAWGNGAVPSYQPAEPVADGERLKLQNRRTEQANVCIGARSASYTDPQRFAVDLMTAVLGEGMSSRLFLHLREDRGLAYDVHAFTVKHRDSGAIGIYIGCEPRRAAAATEAAVAELEQLAGEPVGELELRKARALILGRLLLQLEGTSSLATFLGQQELLTGEILLPDELVRRIEAVSADDVQRAAVAALDAGLRGAVIGPFAKPDKFEKILARTAGSARGE
jgi:predicted Zn-dependent peptidase